MEDYNEDKRNITNEVLINHNIFAINNLSTVSKATVKIILSSGIGSGFFLKTERYNKPLFYCLITNCHVITEGEVKAKNEICLQFDGQKELKFKLDEEERIILNLEKCLELKLDVIIVEILPKDKIDDSYFLLPNNEVRELNEFIGKKIRIAQYPGGGPISLSYGTIQSIFKSSKNYFFHNSDTKSGSSGSPIMFDSEERVIGIHKGKKNKKNIGIFIEIVIDIIFSFAKKNGKRKEFYKEGNLKYYGNFIDDEYDDELATYYYENGDYYIGSFKTGKKNGIGKEYYKNGKLKYEGNFKEDIYNDENAKFYYENGEFYVGSFKDGQKIEGIEYYEKDKMKYQGKYLNDLYEGNEEKYYYKNGDVYIGPFREGKKNGKGCLIKSNGDFEEIEFVDDELLVKKESDDKKDENNNNDNNIIEDNENNNNDIQRNEENIINNNQNNEQNSNNNNSNNNKSHNNNNSNENNNSDNNMIKSAFIQLAEIFQPLGEELYCTRPACKHKVKRHKKIEFGNWECHDCPLDNNICSMWRD